MQAPQVNSELIENLSTFFPKRNESNFALEHALSLLSSLPNIAGFFPMGNVRRAGASFILMDITGGNSLSPLATPTTGYEGIIPYTNFVRASSQGYQAGSDLAPFKIIGTESWVVSGQKGLTLGCWIKPATLPAGGQYYALISKHDIGASPEYQYSLFINPGGALRMHISSDGSTDTGIVTFDTNLTTDTWQFVCGRWTPSTQLKLWVNEGIKVNTTAIDATLYDGTAVFSLGVFSVPINDHFYNGKMSMVFICASALSDTIVRLIYQLTRPIFGI